jgi:hypothetical protein
MPAENFQEPQNDKGSELLLRNISPSISAKCRNFLQSNRASRHFFPLARGRGSRDSIFRSAPLSLYPDKLDNGDLRLRASTKVDVVDPLLLTFVCGRKKKKKVGRSERPTRAGINVCFARRAFDFFFFSSLRRQYFSMCTPNCGFAVIFSQSLRSR